MPRMKMNLFELTPTQKSVLGHSLLGIHSKLLDFVLASTTSVADNSSDLATFVRHITCFAAGTKHLKEGVRFTSSSYFGQDALMTPNPPGSQAAMCRRALRLRYVTPGKPPRLLMPH
eukprot:316482-Amphidinium_carterae.1